jgi:hypothetical protein
MPLDKIAAVKRLSHVSSSRGSWPEVHILTALQVSSSPDADVAGGLINAISLIVLRLTMILLFLFTLLLSSNIVAFFPAVPLAVRSPYLNCWLHNNGETNTVGQIWPTTPNRSQVCHPRIF